MYTSARTALGLERAKRVVTFCFNDRCGVAKQNDFYVLLETVENLISHDSKAAEEAVAGLHEAAAEEGGAPEVALGALVAPPAARSEAEGHADDQCG